MRFEMHLVSYSLDLTVIWYETHAISALTELMLNGVEMNR